VALPSPDEPLPVHEGEPKFVDHQPEYKVAEVRDGLVIVEMEDGRMFPVPLPDTDLKLRKGSKIELSHDGLDKEGVPANPTITS
jgi:hypothetical protein